MNHEPKKVAVVGGGAAGFFLAVCLKEAVPQADVTIFERSQQVLGKVRVSGGGRCNCTNSFQDITDLAHVYPRGHRLLRRLFRAFSHRDAYEWFERHGVALTTQPDHCVFPASQSSATIIDCFLRLARSLGVGIHTGHAVSSLEELSGYDFIAVTTGGSPRMEGLGWLQTAGHEIEPPVPSLFTFSIADASLQALMGTVAENAVCQLTGTRLHASGPLLVTHWGMSGPAILKLSSLGARLLHEHHYKMPLSVNWTGLAQAEVLRRLQAAMADHRQKQQTTLNPFGLPQRLWSLLACRALGERAACRWGELSKKDVNRWVNVLTNDTYQIAGRAAFKDEFVTCGGVSLRSVCPSTLESRVRPGLYFAGEVLDIDGVTGGFNFQAAWTTAFVVAQSIAAKITAQRNS